MSVTRNAARFPLLRFQPLFLLLKHLVPVPLVKSLLLCSTSDKSTSLATNVELSTF